MDIQRIKELALINGFKLKEQASGNMDLNAYVYDFANAIEREVRAQADQKIKLLLCDEHLKKCESPTGIFNSQYPDEEPCLICLAKEAKAKAVPEGFVLISAEQLSQWGHMANYAEQYGCPECFEARGYAHNLGCEINAYFNVSEAQEPK